MTKIEKYICNYKGCHSERAGNRPLQIFSHTTPDASGNGSEHWQAEADLCAVHLLAFAQYLIGRIEDKNVPKKLVDAFENFNIMYDLR